MSLALYMTNLKDKHNEIEEEIKNEMARPLPDFILITKLKKKKLKLKEMMRVVGQKIRGPAAKTA